MTSHPHPALTPELLTRVLHAQGLSPASRIESFTLETIGEGVGFTSHLARLRLRYAGQADGAPASLVAKWSSSDPKVLAWMKRIRLYEREARFYTELADSSRLRTPHCFHAACDPDTGGCLLLLEDLAPARPGDNVVGSPPAESALVLGEVAKLHAAWWKHPQLPALDWIPRAMRTSRD